MPQVEQGLGLGSGFPFFNRCTGSATRFLKLRDVPETSRSPPPVLVLHARAGTAIGDMASYDYFTLGGPFSVRTARTHAVRVSRPANSHVNFLCLNSGMVLDCSVSGCGDMSTVRLRTANPLTCSLADWTLRQTCEASCAGPRLQCG